MLIAVPDRFVHFFEVELCYSLQNCTQSLGDDSWKNAIPVILVSIGFCGCGLAGWHYCTLYQLLIASHPEWLRLQHGGVWVRKGVWHVGMELVGLVVML